MATLNIYDSEGNQFDAVGEKTDEINNQIEQFTLASVKIIAEPNYKRVTGYFRASPRNDDQRSEQFYAEYVDQSSKKPYINFVNAVASRLNDWEYDLEYGTDSMEVLQTISGRQWNVTPGEQDDVKKLKQIINSSELTTVGVSGAQEAVGLSREFAAEHSVVIMGKETFSVVSDYDIAIVVGDYEGIEPLELTEEKMKQEEIEESQEGNGDEGTEQDEDGGSLFSRLIP